MAKRQKPQRHPGPWEWLCASAAAEGIDIQNLSLSAAADCALRHLERRRHASLPLTPGAVDLAARLIQLQGEWAVSGASSAAPFLERAHARARARLLADRYTAGQHARSRLGTIPAEPAEPKPEPDVTLYDLVRLCRSLGPNK